ncbi:hypothetical protein [Leadbettera azotonutricia]|uniref:Uncharacterized protein n=1 Tax=Leadbettera azotonutricia (strain ATCC BAA-888 / DSM 13862 / ZAS-9) TaxID=545695 RepID=F5YBJ3_LEAAZ|nr:hypothetical protein [Leadbettera azotonutricia]AEF83384.1 hypothetical protein TREAZ_0590 [Leadbettera azotonutricia ZAS-9]
MKISYPNNGKGKITFDLSNPVDKKFHDEREEFKNLVYKDVMLGREKRESVKKVLILERDAYQKRYDDEIPKTPVFEIKGFGIFFYPTQIDFFNGLIEELDNLDLSHLDTETGEGSKGEVPKDSDMENHYLIARLKTESLRTYNALKKAICVKIIEFDGSYFNFKIKAGLVGLFFKEGGFTEWETIVQYIKIKGRISETNTLKTANEGKDISKWDNLRKQLFD